MLLQLAFSFNTVLQMSFHVSVYGYISFKKCPTSVPFYDYITIYLANLLLINTEV